MYRSMAGTAQITSWKHVQVNGRRCTDHEVETCAKDVGSTGHELETSARDLGLTGH